MNKSFFGRLGLLILASGTLWGAVYPSTGTVKQREAAQSLGESKNLAGLEGQLLEAMDNKDAVTRAMAVESAGKKQVREVEGKLAQLLVSDPSPEVREAAAMSLRQMNDPNTAEALGKALNDTAVNVRTTALMGIGQYKDRKSRPLVEAAAKDKDVRVRRSAAYVLGRLEDPKSVPVLEGMLKDSDANVRAGAAQALGLMRSKGSLPALRTLLSDTDKGAKISAARSLMMMGDPSGLEAAKSLVTDENLPVRLLAVDTLGWSKDPAAGSKLQELAATVPPDTKPALNEAVRRHEQMRKRK